MRGDATTSRGKKGDMTPRRRIETQWRVNSGGSFVICCTTTAMRRENNNQPKEGCAAKMGLTGAMDDGSVSCNDGKDASATTAMMPVQQGHWHGQNNGKDAKTTKGLEGGQEECGGGHDPFTMACTVMKALFCDGGGRRQEGGVNTTIS
jgi:hypothetical protein